MESIGSAWTQVSPLVINILTALAFILVGYLVARGLSLALTLVLKLIQLDKGSKQIGFNILLEKGEIKKTISELLGDVIYWVILLITVIGTAKYLGLPIESALANVFAYFGLVFLAALVLGIGLLFASLFAGIMKVIVLNFDLEGGKTLSRFVYYLVVIITFIAALAQLGISPEVFVPQIGVIIGAFGLAAAIAFGLGCKDMAADFLHNLFKGK